MLADTIERVNRLRKQALNNPDFIRSSKEHERSIASTVNRYNNHYSNKARLLKRFDEVYGQTEFDVNPSGTVH